MSTITQETPTPPLQTHPDGRPLTPEESEIIAELRERTREAWELKQRYSQCAEERRAAINKLRDLNWSFRRIGETINVSGQRVDSMIRLGQRLLAPEEPQPEEDSKTEEG